MPRIRVMHRACGHCGSLRTVSNGSSHGRHQWQCHECGRSFRATTGTSLAQFKTPVAEVAQPLLVALRQGSLRAAAEITGHKLTMKPSGRGCGGQGAMPRR